MLSPDDLPRVYRLHAPAVFRRARRLLGSDAEANEIVQDVFLALFERPQQFQGQSTLTTYLYSATTHACLNRLRALRTRARLLDEHGASLRDLAAVTPTSPEHLLMLQSTLERMPSELAQVSLYHFMDGLTQEEIAEIMGCSRRHVGDLLQRAQGWTRSEDVLP